MGIVNPLCLYSVLECTCQEPLIHVVSKIMRNIPPPSHGQGLRRDSCMPDGLASLHLAALAKVAGAQRLRQTRLEQY